jgi:hypothetical protein
MRHLAAICALLLAGLAGCDDYGVLPSAGASEPLQVEGGEFFPGPLPSGSGPKVDTFNSAVNPIVAGEAGIVITGDADPGATTVLLAFADLGTGYWSVPVMGPDFSTPPNCTTDCEIGWTATCDFSRTLALGDQTLLLAAMNADGVAGPSQSYTLFVESFVPTECPPGSGTPCPVVISLAWDSGADLDIHLVAPDGIELDPQNPTTATSAQLMMAGGEVPAGTGYLDHDSNAGCVEDGYREEDVVFPTWPAPGTYVVRVDMFSSCGAPAANFTVTVRANGVVKGTFSGRLLAVQADGGGPGSGLFITDLGF